MCRLWNEAFQTEAFKELFNQFENMPSSKQMGKAMLNGTYSHDSNLFTRAADGYHFFKSFIDLYKTQPQKVLQTISELVDDTGKYQIFLDRFCFLSFIEYLVYFLDEQIAGGKERSLLKKEEAFISYSTKNKIIAGKIKLAFEDLRIDSFMAHEDIQPSQEWQKTILEHLAMCSIFVPVISEEFMESEWTQQEAGMVMNNPGIIILPICISICNPPGFLARYQALKIKNEFISAWLIGEALIKEKTTHVLPYLVDHLKYVNGFRGAEDLMATIMPHLDKLSAEQVVEFADGCIKNAQVWDASLCNSEMIPEFIRRKGSLIPKDKLKVLQYQIDKHEWWPVKPTV
jgi:hypothetical protein